MVFGVITPDAAWHVTNDLRFTLGQVWGFCLSFEACLPCCLMPMRPLCSPPLPAYLLDKLSTCTRKWFFFFKKEKKQSFGAQSNNNQKKESKKNHIWKSQQQCLFPEVMTVLLKIHRACWEMFQAGTFFLLTVSILQPRSMKLANVNVAKKGHHQYSHAIEQKPHRGWWMLFSFKWWKQKVAHEAA